MGGGAGLAGQVLAGPLFCLINNIIIHKMRGVSLIEIIAVFFSLSCTRQQ